MGGMAAQIPIKGDAAANDAALAKVRADKRREANDGHDGTWVAHPALVAIAREEFAIVKGDNQLDVLREDVEITAADLLAVPEGKITDGGLRENLRVGVQYLEAWLRGNGCVPLYNLMEDAATAEISRTQVWQWIHHGAKLDDGRTVDRTLVESVFAEELDRIRVELGADRFDAGCFDVARDLFNEMMFAEELPEFLTSRAYDRI